MSLKIPGCCFQFHISDQVTTENNSLNVPVLNEIELCVNVQNIQSTLAKMCPIHSSQKWCFRAHLFLCHVEVHVGFRVAIFLIRTGPKSSSLRVFFMAS